MKEKILLLLDEKQGKYLSGEEISNLLSVSRTAVWKQIKSLRSEGYKIESSSRLGYRLPIQDNLLFPQTIQKNLLTHSFGQQVYYYPNLESTNNMAKCLANEGAQEGSLIIAEAQSRGKGRLGRSWVSPFGKGLWFSLILRPPLSPLEAPKVVILTAVALQEAIREYTGLPVGIKWPNDLLLEGKKVAGILLEMSGEMEKINHLILGVGLNVNLEQSDFPADCLSSSLSLEAKKNFSRVEILQIILIKLEKYYHLFLEKKFSLILNKWKEASLTLGKLIKVTTVHEILEGRAIEFSEQGNLLIKLEDGSIRTITAGDVSLLG